MKPNQPAGVPPGLLLTSSQQQAWNQVSSILPGQRQISFANLFPPPPPASHILAPPTTKPTLQPSKSNDMSMSDAREEILRLANQFNLAVSLSPVKNTPDYLSNIPAEVRIKIYQLLLTNPLLGTPEACPKEEHVGRSSRYSLDTSILRVSKRIYKEASGVLYGENQFYLGCVTMDIPIGFGRIAPVGAALVCPLLRYEHPITRMGGLNKFPLLAMVRQWKVVLSIESQFNKDMTVEKLYSSTSPGSSKVVKSRRKEDNTKKYPRTEPNMFDLFCRTVARSQINELDVAVIRSFEPNQEVESLENVLEPLKLLRNVNFAVIREAQPRDMPDGFLETRGPEHGSTSEPLEFVSSLIDPLIAVVKKQEKIEIATEMWQLLHAYVQPFEPRHDFISFEWGKSIIIKREEGAKDSDTWFSVMREHPVEQAIIHAYLAAKANDNEEFKAQRRIVIEYLEPQYKRMATAWVALREWVESELSDPEGMFRGGIYRDTYRNSRLYREDINYPLISAQQSLAHIVHCFEAGKRDAPHKVHLEMRIHEYKRPRGCKPDERKQVIRDLENALEKEYLSDYRDYHRKAFDILELQWMRIREARKALFEADHMADPQYYVDLGKECDNKLVWSTKHGY